MHTISEHVVQRDFLLPIPLWDAKKSRMPTMLPDPMLENANSFCPGYEERRRSAELAV
jgi:hypothetical protein